MTASPGLDARAVDQPCRARRRRRTCRRSRSRPRGRSRGARPSRRRGWRNRAARQTSAAPSTRSATCSAIDRVGGDVVEEEQRLGTGGEHVVDAVRGEVGAAPAQLPGAPRRGRAWSRPSRSTPRAAAGRRSRRDPRTSRTPRPLRVSLWTRRRRAAVRRSRRPSRARRPRRRTCARPPPPRVYGSRVYSDPVIGASLLTSWSVEPATLAVAAVAAVAYWRRAQTLAAPRPACARLARSACSPPGSR